MEPAVFLDRDNTLIANDGDLGDPEAVRLLDGVPAGLKALREAGYRLIVVTNQGGVARGAFTEDDVDAVHQRVARLISEAADSADVIDRFYYCPYHPQAEVEAYRRDHSWRKPQPGMLLQAARDMKLDLARCWMVGDQPRDIEAGRSAGCRTVRIGDGTEPGAEATVTVQTFTDAVQTILHDAQPRRRALPANGGAVSARPPSTAGPETTRAGDDDALSSLRAAISDLADELRSERQRRVEFSSLRLAAGLTQLLTILLAVLGLLQLSDTDAFVRWMTCAILAQLLTVSILVVDLKS